MQQPTVGRCSWWAPWAAGATRQPTYKRPSRPSVRSALTAFNLYRSTTDTVALTAANKLNTSVLTTASYTDRTAANGTTYTYVLTAVDKALPAHDNLVAADGTGPYTSVRLR